MSCVLMLPLLLLSHWLQ